MSKRKPEPNGRSLEEALRRIIREEVGSRFDAVGEQLGSLGDRLGSLEKRVAAGFAWTEEQFEWVSQRFDAVDRQFTDLKKMLEGLIDEKYPPIDQQPRLGGSPSVQAIAAKGRP